jgi:tetratricopeptide (TPR) repeat protein
MRAELLSWRSAGAFRPAARAATRFLAKRMAIAMSIPRSIAGVTTSTRCRAIALALLAAIAASDSAWCAPPDGVAGSAATLTQHARARYSEYDYAAAREYYSRAIRSAEVEYGAADIALLEPLIGLADTLRATQQFDAAIEPLTRAVGILRRDTGLYDERQYLLLMQLTDLHSLLGDATAATSSLAYMERVSESTHGRHSLQHALALTNIAAWHCRLGRFDSGRERYRRSIQRLQGLADADALIEALLGFAGCCLDELAAEGIATAPQSLQNYRGPIVRTHRMSVDSPSFQLRVLKVLGADGDQALRRAAQLAETKALAPERRVAVLLRVGDWFQAKDRSRTARRYYTSAQTWAQRAVGAEDPFAAPVQVLYPVPPLALRSRGAHDSTAAERFIELEFTVRADGHVDNERVVMRAPGKSAADETMQALQVARFRPRMVNGQALDTTGVRFRQPFN